MGEEVSYEKDRCGWVSLHNAAVVDVLAAIKKLKRIGFTDQAIGVFLETLLEEDMKIRKGE